MTSTDTLRTGDGGYPPHPAWEVQDEFAALERLARRMAPHAVSWDVLLTAAGESRAA